jgi:hypothetical protein
MRDWMCTEHQKHWQSTPGHRHTKNFLSKLSAKNNVEFLKLSRFQARQVTSLLKGHCHLTGHLFKLGITDSPICGRCHKETDITLHILFECEALSELRFCHLSKHFMEPSDYDKIPLCKILYFIGGKGLLAEGSKQGCTIDQTMVTLNTHPTHINSTFLFHKTDT